MKRILILSLAMTFLLSLSASPVFAGGGYHHHGHGYGYWSGWDALFLGLTAGILGAAIVSSAQPEHEVIVEHDVRYYPAPPPPPTAYPDNEYTQYHDYPNDPPRSYVPARVWVPGYYVYQGGGHYSYIPGHWGN